MKMVFLFFITIVGACFGSFLCCQARRFHYNSNHKRKLKNPNSICMKCGKKIKWYDNIPVLSWLLLRGKCRYCHHRIGATEILSELSGAICFLLLSINFDPFTQNIYSILIYVATLLLSLLFLFLAIYDGLYGELPTFCLLLSIVCSVIIAILKVFEKSPEASFDHNFFINTFLSLSILGGLYLILYLVSKGRWVGDGDWLFAAAIGIALGHPILALLALFISNSLPLIKTNPKAKIFFGPFLLIAFIIVNSFSQFFFSFML